MKDGNIKLVQALLDEHLSRVAAQLIKGEPPAVEQLDILDRLARLKILMAQKKDDSPRKAFEIGMLLIAMTALLCAVYFRVTTTPVELEIHASNVEMGLTEHRSNLLLPGEHGEVVALKQANISGATEVEPRWVNNDGGALELRQTEPSSVHSPDAALRLQGLTLPPSGSVTLAVSIAYRPGLRGLVFSTVGRQPTTGSFGQVIGVPFTEGGRETRPAVRPVIVSGNEMRLELFPVDDQARFTALRDIPISTVNFESAQDSGILGGSVFVKNLSQSKIPVQPGDHLQLKSDRPMLIRELTFSKGQLNLSLSAPGATVISVGDEHPRNLMPTFFDWVRSRWPTQMYTTLSALVVLWLSVRRWWSSSS